MHVTQGDAPPYRAARRRRRCSRRFSCLPVFSPTTSRWATCSREHPQRALTIDVVGHQWWWEVQYENPDPSKSVGTANEIHVPVGEPVQFKLRSTDVIHSFWAPNLNGKRDLIPGYVSTLWFKADTAGVYRGQCAEFCGLQHAQMAFFIVAEPRIKFNAWLAAGSSPPDPPTDSTLLYGQRVFMSSGCSVCHAIGGTEARATVGPDLTHFKGRIVHRRRLVGQHARQPHAVDREPVGNQTGRANARAAIQAGGAGRARLVSGDAQVTGPRPFDLRNLPGRSHARATAQSATTHERSTRRGVTTSGVWGWLNGGRPQDDRQAVHRHGISDVHCRRHRGGLDAAAAGPPREYADRARPVQPAVHHARHDDDVPLRRADHDGHGPLLRSAHGGGAQHRLSAAQRVRVLELRRWRRVPLRVVVREHGPGCRVVRLRPALRPAVFAGPPRGRLGAGRHVHRDRRPVRRGECHRHRVQDARPGHVAQSHTVVRVGAARRGVHDRVRHAGRRRRAAR